MADANAVLRSPLALCLTAALAGLAARPAVAQSRLDYDPALWVLCRPNALFDFYRPLRGTAADRESAETTLYARSFDIRDQSSYLLEGDVEILRADQRVAAAMMRYDPESEAWTAQGDVQYQDSGMLIGAERAEGQLENDQASLEALRYQLLAARGNGEAEKAENHGDVSTLTGVSYTTCDPGNHQWSIHAGELKIDQAEGIGTARHATLRFGRVPVLYLPIASFPIDDRRKTGFLFPSLGASRSRGVDVATPYYIDIAPNLDATLTPRLMTKRGVMLGAEFRYLFDDHRGRVYGTYLPDDNRTDRDRGTFTWEHRGTLSPHWQLIANLNHVSDDRYFEDFGDSLSTAATSLLDSNIGVYGRGANWNASLALQSWTISDPYLPDSSEPYRRLPRALFNWEQPFAGILEAGLRSEGVVFEHSEKPGATRVDLYPYLAFPYERAAGFIRPEIGLRHTTYQLDDAFRPAYTDTSPSRTTPILSLDAGLVFERPTHWFGNAMVQTLEPRLYYLNVPYRDQSNLPILDTQELGFSWGQLFRSNRFAGADRQSDANQATLAITTRLFEEATGQERLSASLGQIRYFQAQRVQMPGVATVDRAGSAYVGDLELALDDRWSVGVSQQWDPNRELSDLSTLRSQYRWGEAGGVMNFAYRFRRDGRGTNPDRVALEQLDASVLYPINAQWRLVGRWNYSLEEKTTLEAFAGVEWENCCLATRVLMRRYVRNVEGEINNSLYIELELKGLSTLGRKSGELVERAILGYSR